MAVFVLDKHQKPLMPCSEKRARLLLERGRARVHKMYPFTIRLVDRVQEESERQETRLKLDPGSKTTGVATTLEGTNGTKAVFLGEIIHKTGIKSKLDSRRSLRRSRRNRKTRYRQPRFLNRPRPSGWLPPSLEARVHQTMNAVAKLRTLMPITAISVEHVKFDTQALQHAEISGVEYQQGAQMGFWNVREYVLFRDKHTCQWCHGKSGDKVLNVHHRESRKTGGDSPDNLVTLCETCHHKIHKEALEDQVKCKTTSLRDATQMTVLRWFVYHGIKAEYPQAKLTYGYITKNTRIRHGLAKSHNVDARCISGNPLATPSETTYLIKQVRGQNRQLHKATILKGGIRKANKAPRYLFGYQLFDKVEYQGQECFIFGRRSSGSFDLRLLDGTKITAGISHKKLMLIECASTMLVQIITPA